MNRLLLCLSVLVLVVALSACQPDPNSPRGVAERFLDAHYVRMDLQAAKAYCTGLALKRVEDEIRLTEGQVIDANTRLPRGVLQPGERDAGAATPASPSSIRPGLRWPGVGSSERIAAQPAQGARRLAGDELQRVRLSRQPMVLFRQPGYRRGRPLSGRPGRPPLQLCRDRRIAHRPAPGCAVDHHRVLLGYGRATFRAARAALDSWQMFRLGWVSCGHRRALLASRAGTCPPFQLLSDRWLKGRWSPSSPGWLGCGFLNACRVVYVWQDAGAIDRFGFAMARLTPIWRAARSGSASSGITPTIRCGTTCWRFLDPGTCCFVSVIRWVGGCSTVLPATVPQP